MYEAPREAYRSVPLPKERKKWRHPKLKHDNRNAVLAMLARLMLAGALIVYIDARWPQAETPVPVECAART